MTMDRGMNQVRVRGANTPPPSPRGQNERTDWDTETDFFLDRPVEPGQGAFPGATEAFGDFFSKYVGDPISAGYNTVKDWYGENIFPNTPGGQLEERGFSGWGDLLRRSGENWLSGVQGALFNDGTQGGAGDIAPNPFTNSEPAQEMVDAPSFDEILGQYQFDGSAYDQAADYMMERREAQMRAIQDMYNQYAAETQANVDRIGNIYGGAQEGVGQTYDSATGNIQDAYGSAQQQAADQMARLGIEEAAPKVIDPMALSQAEDVSSLETNRASTLGATEQFGATAGDFATNMATVAQQGALENQRGATEQLADQLFELEMQRAEAQQAYNPYQRAMQDIEARATYENMINPPVDDSQAYEREQDLQDRWESYYARNLDSTASVDEAMERTVLEAARGMLGPELQQRVLADPQFAPFLPE